MAEAFPIALDAHEFLVDLAGFETATIEAIREQADTSEQFGEQSLNPMDLWRRSVDDWRFGAGQRYLDKSDSERARFYKSKGVDPWNRDEVRLLKDVETFLTNVDSDIGFLTTDEYLVTVDADDPRSLRWVSPDGSSFTSCGFNQDILLITTDGVYIYFLNANDDLRRGEKGESSASYTTIKTGMSGDHLWYLMGRLILADGPDLYNIVDTSTTTPPPAFTASAINDNFVWTAAGEGAGFIWLAGHSGDYATIYSTAIQEDGTDLETPKAAAPLPAGEICHDILGYLGFLILATSAGVRLAVPTEAGFLEYGPLIEIPAPVRTLTPWDSFVWFGWTDYDGTSSGLGRLDMRTFIPDLGLVPAYASDLMATAQGDVTFSGTFDLKRCFQIGTTVYREVDDYIASGTIQSGLVSYNLPDQKALYWLEVRGSVEDATDTIDYAVEVDGVEIATGDETVSTSGDVRTVSVDLDGAEGELAEIILTLNNGTDASTSLTLRRWTLRSNPMPRQGQVYNLPIILREDVTGLNGRRVQLDPEEEWTWLLSKVGKSVTFREGEREHRAYLDGVARGPELSFTRGNDGFQGIATVRLRVFE